MDYFSGCVNKESRKKRFKDLAKKHHPDKGGDADIFKEINRQYNSGASYSDTSNYFRDAFSYGFQSSYTYDWGDWDFLRKAEAKRKEEQERKLREEEKKIKEAYADQEAANKFYRDKSQPQSEHGEHLVPVNSRDTLKMFSIYGNHEYRYDVFSDSWVRK